MALFSGHAYAQNPANPLLYVGSAEYYIKGISQNGEWAFGTYLAYDNSTYGFRWDLKNNKIELLGTNKLTNDPTGISNDGVLVGYYNDNTIVENGAYVKVGGYWENGQWKRLSNPLTGSDALDEENELTLAINCISPDGHWMGGTDNFKNVIVWKDGVMDWSSKTGFTCSSYCISADGQMAAGWSYMNDDSSRTPVLWRKGQNPVWLAHSTTGASIYQTGNMFSSNNKWLLYWGGYNEVENQAKMTLYAIYDLEKNKSIEIPCATDYPGNIHYYYINSNGTAIGSETGRMITGTDEEGNPIYGNDSTYLLMYKDGKVSDLYKHLEARGVDFKSLPAFASLITNDGMSFTDDERTYAFRYADTLGGVHPIVIKFGENMTSRPPVQVAAQRYTGVSAVLITWMEPLANAKGVKAYRLYRNGQMMDEVSSGTLRYIDKAVELGKKYNYMVKAVYDEGESEPSDSATVVLNAPIPQAPISMFARQIREASAIMQWDVPKSNLTVKRYYDDADEVSGFGALDESFECAIKFSSEEMALYKGQKLTAVDFYPMSKQDGWTLNVYTKDTDDGALHLLYTKPITQILQYGKSNKVLLDKSLDIPEGKSLYVAIAVKPHKDNDTYNVLGEVTGKVNQGYSDLLRSIEFDDPDFFSVYEEGLKSGSLSQDTWAIDAIFTPENADPKIDDVASYAVMVDGKEVATTTEKSYETSLLAVGKHTLGVAAVYADGRRSSASEVTLDVTENMDYYQAPQNVYAEPNGGQGITAHWSMPADKGNAYVTYAYGDGIRPLAGHQTLGYNYRTRVDYTSNMFRGYDGYKITALRFCPTAESDYTLLLYKGEDLICEVPVLQYNKGGWNEVPLPTPVEVEQGVTYSFEVDSYDTEEGGSPMAVDNGVEIEGVSNLISTDDGQTFTS